ncbi:unnamed protein product [Blepharisma stoltei]|uniref:EGF-like domain-containing protein n=1 Tax=Blepharisma stoltei TaxID=1481888 RepID=A0AAU9JA22_9CILI|nr:unnamed protein product [Blepharisma stoltei]
MDRTCSTCEVSGCDTCTSGQTCSKCATGYYLDSNSCKACSGFNKNCQECSGAGFCTNCKTGYVASDSGTCFASSIPNCKVLNADGVSCKTCLSGYYENNGSCAQIACTGIQYWDGVNKQCTMCSTIDPDCTICTSDKKCTSCSVGKIANDAGLCSTSTLTHCSLGNSTDPKYCTKCSTGYISDGIGGCIQSQLQRCKEASSATVCKICSSGTASGCGPCSPTSAVPDCACASQGGSVCTRCNDGYTLKAGSCSLTIACSSNCADCSSIDICTQCNSGYFLYDESATKTSCVCKIYLACADSCNLCTNSPVCFECADLVVQDGSSCRVDKVGYQLSFDSPDAVIDFAHPLSKTVGFNSFTASKGQASVPTGGWSIKSSTVSQIKVQTDLDETKLPIDITFSFKQNES